MMKDASGMDFGDPSFALLPAFASSRQLR